jgi:hypothetical protein
MMARSHRKMSQPLRERIEDTDATEPVDVVLELRPVPIPAGGSRTERMAQLRSSFEEELATVGETVRQAGGTVLESAWINQSVRCLLPPAALEQVARSEQVVAIDLPSRLEAEG